MSTTESLNGKATTKKTAFSRETAVSIVINAEPAVVWSLLTNSANYPKWNSTVTSLEGTIALGSTIKLKSILDAKRVFRLKVKTFEPERVLSWGDGQGNRIYRINKNPDGTVTFSMTEKIGGVMFPLYAGMIPSFDQGFEQFARDLKSEAEERTRTNNK